jgi:hypothetical protein
MLLMMLAVILAVAMSASFPRISGLSIELISQNSRAWMGFLEEQIETL